MLSKSVYATDVRVRREAETLAAMGHRVTVVCLGSDESAAGGVNVIGLGELTGLKGRGRFPRTGVYAAARWMLLPNHRRISNTQFATGVRQAVQLLDIDADVVHAHDFPALEAAALLDVTDHARLVYDSHEYWRGMTRYGRPDPIAGALDRRRESRLAQKADAVITVSEGAARLLREALRVDQVVVVRNTFPINPDLSPPETPRGAVYAGRIGSGRDLETILSASVWDGLDLHLIGPSDDSIDIPRWVSAHPPAPLQHVDGLLASAGIALVPLTKGPQNHDVALPNKLFQAISLGVPVVAANLPEMADLVRTHHLGEIYEPGDPQSFDEAIGGVVDRYQALVDSVRRAAPSFDWSQDSLALKSTYESISTLPKQRGGVGQLGSE